jgi:hypothetical protein
LVNPNPVASEYFETRGGGFVINTDREEVTYAMSVTAIKPMPEGAVLEATFENPRDPSSPFVVNVPLPPEDDFLVLKSPPVNGLRAYSAYSVDLILFRGPAKASVVARHRQYIRSTFDQSLLFR